MNASSDPAEWLPSARPGSSARTRRAVAAPSLAPRVRLFASRVAVRRASALSVACEEVLVPLLALDFVGADGVASASEDDEASARRVLERLGAVELSCLDDVAPPYGVHADYVVHLDGDEHAFCDFSRRALPQLEAEGFLVEVAADYPFQVVATDPGAPGRWYAEVTRPAEGARSDDERDWFGLELGIEVDGERVDLLPVIMAMVDEAEGGDGGGDGDGLRALSARVRSSYALRISETRCVTVGIERLRALVQVVTELYLGSKGGGFPGARAAALARLDEAFAPEGLLVWRDPSGVLARGRRVIAAPAPVVDPAPAGLKASLRDYQRLGVMHLQHHRESGFGAVLADDMGLGKTLQTIAHLCLEKEAGRLTLPALVVGPTSLVGNWQKELARFAPHLKVVVFHGPERRRKRHQWPACDVVITTYPVLVRDQDDFTAGAFSTVILDEAQAIKNARSLAHRAACLLPAEHRVCLTGTPVENHLGELWALFEFLNPGLLGDEASFSARYRRPLDADGEEARLEELRTLTAPHVLRRLKRDVARELPPKTEVAQPVELTGAQRDLYEHIRVAAHAEVRRAIKKKGLAGSALPILDALMKLRQVCCDPRLVAMDAARSVEESAKREAFDALVSTLLGDGHRVLVFSQFTSMLALLAEGLRARGTRYLALTGKTKDRQRVVDAFERGDADVFLISLKAGGTGLNLTSADTVIHYDPWWNPAAQAQATDRAYRIGQSKPVFVYNLYVAGSVEERVLQLQERKRWLSATLLGDQAGAASRSPLAEADIDALFSPLGSGGADDAPPDAVPAAAGSGVFVRTCDVREISA